MKIRRKKRVVSSEMDILKYTQSFNNNISKSFNDYAVISSSFLREDLSL